ncbi:MAG: dTDP-4-dehydrorhamnose 3,5-epimerase [Desulfobacula sp.]|uniref:dTDP-4-dehydrorhamnose 3,5-epimerase n=1 Tax=Desulfobacula sp. TaxID=2593537 RepID=UPI0025C22DCA|nr:dTDP-4-dehydrorhamnose 3,5-epimerase [Desulfobacula sp.]MCD4720224.1 dTDP-4-dehydrorhamnose 3,5-epimerase [Desulfobacula sp.]
MKLTRLSIPDVVIMVPKTFGDNRGFFMETFRDDFFRQEVADISFFQDNHSKSSRGILRGLHYQINQPQGKLVRVISGEVFDVAVDLCKSSPTFKKWIGVYLSDENKKILWVPPGFAHGFYVVSPEAEFVYKCTDYYAPEHERSIKWDDPVIDIQWPLIPGISPLLSEKDKKGISFKNAEVFE